MIDVIKSYTPGHWNIVVDGSYIARRDDEIEAKREAVNIINGRIKSLKTDRKRLTDEILDAT